MILYGAFATPRNDQNILNAGLHRFLDDILDRRLIHNWQHLFWLRLRSWQKPSAAALPPE